MEDAPGVGFSSGWSKLDPSALRRVPDLPATWPSYGSVSKSPQPRKLLGTMPGSDIPPSRNGHILRNSFCQEPSHFVGRTPPHYITADSSQLHWCLAAEDRSAHLETIGPGTDCGFVEAAVVPRGQQPSALAT